MEKYPIEFKLEIINQINKGVLSVDEAAHKYHVNRTSVRKWLNVFNLHGAEGLTKPKFIYSGDFKLAVIRDIQNNNLSAREAALKYNISSHNIVLNWEKKFLTGGSKALYEMGTGYATKAESPLKGRPRKISDKPLDEDLISEIKRLRMENDYLKKLNALVQQREKSKKPIKFK